MGNALCGFLNHLPPLYCAYQRTVQRIFCLRPKKLLHVLPQIKRINSFNKNKNKVNDKGEIQKEKKITRTNNIDDITGCYVAEPQQSML